MLLILDEPTEGLDPLMQGAFHALLKESKQRGRTVFMSSHVLSEVERVCDRVALLRQGELVLLDDMDAIRRFTARLVSVHFSSDAKPFTEWPPGHELIETTPRTWRLEVTGTLGPLLAALSGLPVEDLEVREARLEDVVLKYYRGGKQ